MRTRRKQGIGGRSGRMSGGGPVTSSLLANLVAYWKLEDVTASAGGFTLTNNNVATFTAGKVNSALTLVAASDQSASVASDAVLQLGAVDWTIACWVKANTFPNGGSEMFISKGGAEYEVRMNGTDTAFEFNRSDAETVTAGTPATGAWFFICVRRNKTGGTYSISVNDGTPGVLSSATDCATGTNALFIGRREGAAFSRWDGQIDEVGIWRSAAGGGGCLSDAQVTSLYNGGSGRTHPFSGAA